MSSFSVFKKFNGEDYEFSQSFLTFLEAEEYAEKIFTETHIVECVHTKYTLYDVYYKLNNK